MSAAEKPLAVASRTIVRRVVGMPTEDGAGVKLNRLIGQPALPDIDPILMMDVFRSDQAQDYIAGFPEHPHRGFETVSYMVKGSIAHRDNHGGQGLVSDGGVQWMTTGRGVVHSEMPAQTNGQLFGFQLWINLPAAEKMRDPWYRDIPASEIPVIDLGNGASAKLIAGERNGVKGPGPERVTQPFIADVTLAADSAADIPLPSGHTGFVYVFEGSLDVMSDRVEAGEIGVLSDGDGLRAYGGAAGARFLAIGGKPLNEPIAKYGPFVMNTQSELRQAIGDFRAGRF